MVSRYTLTGEDTRGIEDTGYGVRIEGGFQAGFSR